MKMLFVMAFAICTLGACVNQTSLSARENDGAPDSGKEDGKHESPKGIVIEKFRALQLQPPTLDEADFLNTMEMEFDVTKHDRAYFTFSHTPDENGSLYFLLAQTRLHFQSCKKTDEREVTVRIFWQEVQGNKRVLVKEFSPNITEFEFKKGKKYYLTYALMDLKQLADCKAAKLSFATFPKN